MKIATYFLTFIFSSVQLFAGIFEIDSRTLINSNSKPNIIALSKGVAVQIPLNRIKNFSTIGAAIYIGQTQTVKDEFITCPGVAFNEQTSLPVCTAFLVKADMILTAGHCGLVNQAGCDTNMWVFNYTSENLKLSPSKEIPNFTNVEIKGSNAYRCKKIISSAYQPQENGLDYALIQLDRPVTNGFINKLKSSVALTKQDQIFTIGALSGTPLVSTAPDFIQNISSHYVSGPFDLIERGSGGPAYDARTNEIIGIMVSSSKDYFFENFQQAKSNQCQKPFILKSPWAETIKTPTGEIKKFPYTSAERLDVLPIAVKNILGLK